MHIHSQVSFIPIGGAGCIFFPSINFGELLFFVLIDMRKICSYFWSHYVGGGTNEAGGVVAPPFTEKVKYSK